MAKEGQRIINVGFAIPTEGNTPGPALDSLLSMSHHHGKLEESTKDADVRFIFWNFQISRIHHAVARETLMEHALKQGMDYAFMIDDDMLAPCDLFDRLYRHNVDIVAPLAFTRNEPFQPVLYGLEDDYDPVAQKRFTHTYVVNNYPKDKLVEADAVGFGAALIKMDMVKKMKAPYFYASTNTGEDIHFCLNAKKQCGGRTFMDTSTKIGHLGRNLIVDEALSNKYNKYEDIITRLGVWEPKKYNLDYYGGGEK